MEWRSGNGNFWHAESKSVEVLAQMHFPIHLEKLTTFLKLECKIIDGTANNHLEKLETCDDHRHNLWHSYSGSKGYSSSIFPSSHRMALRAK